ncbi:MAG TPA: protein kinase, partial [Myxococcaceae bacterium]|nr:protein kinase [Myxococcaceae bacterium]
MTLATAPRIDIGTVLQDTYELTSLVGQGGMGAVFLARHRRLPGRQVAIKLLHSSFSREPELFARFRREAEIASQLGHPHIVEVLDFDVLPDGTPFLVMEYLRGESLEARLRRGALPVAEALSIARQMGSALLAAHRAGVIHRDLKPANVFLVPPDVGGLAGERVKLLDFGISKIADSQTVQTQEAVLIGTPQYMSPEQAQGRNSEVDARTDIFALGCIVYEMLSGVSPFGGSGGSIVQIIYRIVHEPPEPLASRCPGLPTHIVAAVERALAKEPGARFPDVASFISELTGTPLQALPEAAPALSSPEDDVGFASTLVPSATARTPGPVDASAFDATLVPASSPPSPAQAVSSPEDDVGFAPTLVPAETVRSPVRVDAHAFDDTLVPASSVLPPPPVQARSKLPVVGVGVGLLLLGLAAGWWMRSSPPPSEPLVEPVAVARPATPPAP